jgi:hypothetical protein
MIEQTMDSLELNRTAQECKASHYSIDELNMSDQRYRRKIRRLIASGPEEKQKEYTGNLSTPGVMILDSDRTMSVLFFLFFTAVVVDIYAIMPYLIDRVHLLIRVYFHRTFSTTVNAILPSLILPISFLLFHLIAYVCYRKTIVRKAYLKQTFIYLDRYKGVVGHWSLGNGVHDTLLFNNCSAFSEFAHITGQGKFNYTIRYRYALHLKDLSGNGEIVFNFSGSRETIKEFYNYLCEYFNSTDKY